MVLSIILFIKKNKDDNINKGEAQPQEHPSSRKVKWGVSMAVYGSRHSPYSNYLCRAPDIAAVGTIFNKMGRKDFYSKLK